MGLALSPDGSLLIADPPLHRVWRLRSVMPVTLDGAYLIPSDDGSVVDQFDAQGRHVAMRDGTTGATLLSFTHDARGVLTAISDATSRTTTIDRQGTLVTLTAPSGAATYLTLNAFSRYATAITTRAEATTGLTIGTQGLLTAVHFPLGGTAQYAYTPETGRLERIQSPSGAVTTLARVEATTAYTVTVTDPLNNWVRYGLALGTTGAITRTQTSSSGATQRAVTTLTTSTITNVDGTISTMHAVADPRWGMLASFPITSTQRTAAGTVFASTAVTRTVTGLSLTTTDPFTFTTLHTATVVNGFVATNQQVTTVDYTPANRTYTITDPAGVVTTRVEDVYGRVIQEQTGKQPTTSYSYYALAAGSPYSGLLYRMIETPLSSANPTSAVSRSTTYTYDAHGYPDVITDPLGSVDYNYQFPALLGYTLITAEGLTACVLNRSTGDPATEVSLQGVTTRYTYDSYGRLQSQSVGSSVTSSTTYGYESDMVTSSTISGTGTGDVSTTTTMTPVLVGIDTYLPGTVRDTTDAQTTYTYRVDGQVLTAVQAITAGISGTTTNTYYPQGWLHSTTSPGGHTTSYTYTPDGKVATVTAPGGSVTAYDYDAYGRVDQVQADTTGVGATTTYTYEAGTNRITTVTDPRQNAWHVAYDGYGRTWKETDPLGNTTTTRYDALDHPTQKTVGEHVRGYDYDSLGRLLTTCQDPDGLNLCTRYGYESARGLPRWRVMQVTDPNQQTTFYTYDSRGQLMTTTDALGQNWTFTYNNLGQLVYQSSPRGGITTYTTDGHGQRLSETEGTRTQTWSYRPDGALDAMVDFSGQTIDYVYAGDDGNDGLVSRIDYSGSEADASYTYDDAGNLHTVTDSAGSTTYAYDGLNRLRAQTRQMFAGASYDVRYGYDPAGNLTSLTYPTGDSVIYTYDDAGRMQTMTPWDAGTTTYHYRSSGLLDDQIRGNGVRSDYDYDGAGRLTKLTHALGTTLEEISYPDIDANGNITTRTDSDGSTTYAYDVLNRLTAVSYPPLSTTVLTETIHYAYDADGNRTTVNDAIRADYDLHNRLVGDQQDANGNLQHYSETSPQLRYQYDGANRLRVLSASQDEWRTQTESRAWYDGRGQLIRRQTTSDQGVVQATDLVLDEHGGLARVLVEGAIDSDGTRVQRLYASGPDGIAAQRTITTPVGGVTSDTTAYPLLDGLGTPRLITDATGAALLRLSTDAFGVERLATTVGTGSTPAGFGLGGEPRDSLNGSIYLRARTYQPQAGRFTQRDSSGGTPARPQSLNRYTYTENNPVNNTDPSGHCPWCLIPVVAGALLLLSADQYHPDEGSPNQAILGWSLLTAGAAAPFLAASPAVGYLSTFSAQSLMSGGTVWGIQGAVNLARGDNPADAFLYNVDWGDVGLSYIGGGVFGVGARMITAASLTKNALSGFIASHPKLSLAVLGGTINAGNNVASVFRRDQYTMSDLAYEGSIGFLTGAVFTLGSVKTAESYLGTRTWFLETYNSRRNIINKLRPPVLQVIIANTLGGLAGGLLSNAANNIVRDPSVSPFSDWRGYAMNATFGGIGGIVGSVYFLTGPKLPIPTASNGHVWRGWYKAETATASFRSVGSEWAGDWMAAILSQAVANP